MITAEQFAEWKEHPVTREIFQEIKSTIQDLKDKLAAGQTLGNLADGTHGLTSRTVGQIDGLGQILNISYEDEKVDFDVSDVSEVSWY